MKVNFSVRTTDDEKKDEDNGKELGVPQGEGIYMAS